MHTGDRIGDVLRIDSAGDDLQSAANDIAVRVNDAKARMQTAP